MLQPDSCLVFCWQRTHTHTHSVRNKETRHQINTTTRTKCSLSQLTFCCALHTLWRCFGGEVLHLPSKFVQLLGKSFFALLLKRCYNVRNLILIIDLHKSDVFRRKALICSFESCEMQKWIKKRRTEKRNDMTLVLPLFL